MAVVKPSAFAKILRGCLAYEPKKGPSVKKMAIPPPPDPDGQALMLTCVDARLSPTQFTGAEEADNILYIARNPGNFVPPSWVASGTSTELAALDLVVVANHKRHVLVCGHSTCKAVHLMLESRAKLGSVEAQQSPVLRCLGQAGQPSLEKLDALLASPNQPLPFAQDLPSQAFSSRFSVPDSTTPATAVPADMTDLLSQIHVLQQLENITTHHFLRPAIDSQNLVLHAMWFHIATGSMYYFKKRRQEFVKLDAEIVETILEDELTR